MLFRIYAFVTRLLAPALRALARLRALQGLEDPARLEERRGIPSAPRPPGRLIWVHAASVGEVRSALKLIQHLLAQNPESHGLITTVTRTAARTVALLANPRLIHQYAPFDHPGWVARFLDHWRPDLVLWMESEIWPTTLTQIKNRTLPLAMVNGRLSERSAARWARLPDTIARILGLFDLCLAQSEGDATRLKNLGAPNVAACGNLKYTGDKLPCDEDALRQLEKTIGDRPRLLFASTHAGEEEMAARIHTSLSANLPGLLSIIMPRHPERGDEIARICARRALPHARRSKGEAINSATAIYIADTLGEPGLFFRLCPVVYLGNSMGVSPGGGHNPLEPARLGCAIVYGPSMFNFGEMDETLRKTGGALMARDEADLTEKLETLLRDDALRDKTAKAALAASADGDKVLEKTLALLRPLLERATMAA